MKARERIQNIITQTQIAVTLFCKSTLPLVIIFIGPICLIWDRLHELCQKYKLKNESSNQQEPTRINQNTHTPTN